jgi:hypothetical protein
VTTRLVRTSRGWIAFLFNEGRAVGTSVQVTVFDEDGLGDEPKAWTSKHGFRGGESFDEFLIDEAGLPEGEAEDLAANVLGRWLEEWRRAGGEESSRSFDRLYILFVAGVLVVLALAFLGFALIVWRLVDWIG